MTHASRMKWMIALVVAGGVARSAGQSTTRYVIEALGTLDRETSEAYAINAYGQIVGRVPTQLPERPKAFHWQNGEQIDISDTVHFSQQFVQYRGEAFDLSDGDIIVGAGWNKVRVDNVEIWFADAFVTRPATQTDFGGPFPGDSTTALTSTTGNFLNSAAVGINPSASVTGTRPVYVVGWCDIDTTYRSRGFILSPQNGRWYVAGGTTFDNALMIDLGALSGAFAESAGTAVNDSGDVVGYAYNNNGGYHAYLILPEDASGDGLPDRWNRDNNGDGINDIMLDLGTLGGKNSWGRGVANRFSGQPSPVVVGEADTSALDTHAFVWTTAGGMVDLGTLGGSDSSASRINDLGHVVGWAETSKQEVHGFVVIPEDTNGDGRPDRWYRDNDANGINDLMTDLNAVALAATKWSIREARDINNSGEIAGWGSFKGGDGNSARQAFFMRIATAEEIETLTPPADDSSETPAGGGAGGSAGGGSSTLELDPLFRSSASAPSGSGGGTTTPATGAGTGSDAAAGGSGNGGDCGAGLIFGLPLTLAGLSAFGRRAIRKQRLQAEPRP